MNNNFSLSSRPIQKAIEDELQLWEKEKKVQRLWAGDASLWTNNDEAQWLGWLQLTTDELCDVTSIDKLASEIQTDGYDHIVVLGMGGSSLCPDLIAKTFDKGSNNPRLHILDSTDPLQIKKLEKNIDIKKTIFIVSSKSGSTLEPNIFKDFFYSRVQKILGKSEVGNQFVAITDPGTKLELLAKKEKFRAIFHGIPSIGGRYSALSNFGMLPSGLMGLNIKTFLSNAEKMRQACLSTVLPKDNPGILLGIILGVCAKFGKNKVTMIVSPEIHTLGAWLEQLLAESTGKQGKGIIPIDQEPLGEPNSYGNDRVFIYIYSDEDRDPKQEEAVALLDKAGHVIVRLNMPNKLHLGAEFFRWEIATAVAGSIIGINPFNQPDVEGSKKRAAQILLEYEKTLKIRKPDLIFSSEGIQLFTDIYNVQEIKNHLIGDASIDSFLRAHLDRIQQDDYVNLSAFIEMSETHTEWLQKMRALIRNTKKVATCLGFGPRFLHSTGQAYKGGPNSGVFLQITAEHSEDIPIPGKSFTFGVVIEAQAEADFEVLAERQRRILRIHLGKNVNADLQKLHDSMQRVLKE